MTTVPDVAGRDVLGARTPNALPHVALTGKARAGKDTAGRFLVERYGYTRVAFADGVREVALAIDPYVVSRGGARHRLSTMVHALGWEDAKRHPEVRRLLQVIGTEAGRDIFGSDVWVNLAMRKAAGVDGPLVFTDVRFPSEADAARNLGAIVVRLERDGAGAGDHTSETAMDDYPVAVTIINNGTVAELEDALAFVVGERSGRDAA